MGKELGNNLPPNTTFWEINSPKVLMPTISNQININAYNILPDITSKPTTPLEINEDEISKKYLEASQNPSLHLAVSSLDPKAKKSWNELEIRLMDVIKEGHKLSDKIIKVNPKESANHKTSVDEIFIIIKTAEKLLSSHIHTNIHNFVNTRGSKFLASYSPMEKYGALCSCEDVRAKIEGFSIEDIFRIKEISKKSKEDKKNKYTVELNANISLPDYYKFTVKASLAQNSSNIKNYLETAKTNNPLLEEYAAKAEQLIKSSCTQIAVFSSLVPESFNLFRIPYFGADQENIVSIAREIIKKTFEMKNKIAKTIVSPADTKDFSELSKILISYLDEGTKEEKDIAFEKAGIDSADAQINIYREIQELLSTPLNNRTSIFYTKLTNYLEEIIKKRTDPIVLTINDAPFFIKETPSLEVMRTPQLEDIKKGIRQFYGKNNKSVYELNPQEIPIEFLKVPQNIYAAFLKNNSHDLFTITFVYAENIKSKPSTLNVAIDLNEKEDAFDWQFIESPDDPKMGKVKNAIFCSLPAILNNLQKKILIEHQEEQKKKAIRSIPIAFTPKKNDSIYTPREKTEKPASPKPLTFVERVIRENKNSNSERKEIRKAIIVPGEKDSDTFPKDMSQKELNDLLEKMKRLPEGLGDIRMLEATKDDKEPLYRGKFNKRYRVIIRKAKPEEANNGHDGTQYFVLVKVLRRNDDYKDLRRIIN